MSLQVNDIYLDVCTQLCEPNGFTLGLVTEAQFLVYYATVMMDFLSRSGLIKGIALQPQQYGIPQYTVPDWLLDVNVAFSDGVAIERDFEESLAGGGRNWQGKIGTPRSYYQDKQFMSSISLFPAPIVENPQAPTMPALPNFGIVVAWTPGGTTQLAFIGTVVQASQAATFTTPGVFFNAPSTLAQFWAGNVSMIGTVGLFTQAVTLSSPVESLPDDFRCYIKYGILQKIFSSDGELRDDLRSRFCGARYEEGIMLAKIIMDEAIDNQ